MVDTLPPGACADVSVEMISPLENGIHQGQWRMCTANGLFFGGNNSQLILKYSLVALVTVCAVLRRPRNGRYYYNMFFLPLLFNVIFLHIFIHT